MQTWRFWLLTVFTVTLFIYAITSFRGRPVTYLEQEIKEISLGNIEFDFYTGLFFHKEGQNVNLRGLMPDSLQLGSLPSHCAVYNASKLLCASWYGKVRLEVENKVEEQAKCQLLTWTSLFGDFKPNTCFSMRDVQWYGGSLLQQQTWPLNKADVSLLPYVIHDQESHKGETNTFGNVLDWFWISSSGIAIIVDDSYPLHVSINKTGEKTLCFHSKSTPKPVLKYTICKAENARKIHRYVMKKVVHLPLTLPKENYFKYPMWSTYPMFKNTLDQGKLLKYGKEIGDNNFEGSVIDIYENSLAVLKLDLVENSVLDPFDKSKFPNSQQSLMLLREYKLELVLPVSPFILATAENNDKNKVLQDIKGNPYVIHFHGQDAHILNLLDDTVVDWYIGEIHKLRKEFGITGLHLISGITDVYSFSNKSQNPIDTQAFVGRFISSVSDKTNMTGFSNIASRSQKSGLFIKLQAQTSSWSSAGGLKHLIPSVLNLGMLGYPYVIPDTVGGPGMVKVVNASFTEQMNPDRELYIRWMGVAAYMPCMMFSHPPWLYDEEMVLIAKEFTKQHRDIVAPLVVKAAREYEHIGK